MRVKEEDTKEGLYVAMGSKTLVKASGLGSGGAVSGSNCWRCGKPGHIRAFCKEVPETANMVTSGPGASGLHDVQLLQDLGAREIGEIY